MLRRAVKLVQNNNRNIGLLSMNNRFNNTVVSADMEMPRNSTILDNRFNG